MLSLIEQIHMNNLKKNIQRLKQYIKNVEALS